jgi:putative membrane protein
MLKIFLTGMAMGAADVVPGVSGGTIAFIAGIYERLLNAIRSVRPELISVLMKDGIPAVWQKIDGTFLVVLLAGIGTSVLALARLITYLLATYPSAVWGFFFGLILASSIFLAREVRWNAVIAAFFLAGVGIALYIATIRPTDLEPTTLIIFGSGAIAICAMILPGVSGSFLLLLMGMYATVLDAIKGFDFGFIAIFAAGCACGLLGFSHFLGYMLQHFRAQVLSVLTGFLAGSLLMVWPWQHATSTYTKSDGRVVTLEAERVMPGQFAELTQQDPMTLVTCVCAVVGVALVGMLARLGPAD